jgi:hypothetical protein
VASILDEYAFKSCSLKKRYTGARQPLEHVVDRSSLPRVCFRSNSRQGLLQSVRSRLELWPLAAFVFLGNGSPVTRGPCFATVFECNVSLELRYKSLPCHAERALEGLEGAQ